MEEVIFVQRLSGGEAEKGRCRDPEVGQQAD